MKKQITRMAAVVVLFLCCNASANAQISDVLSSVKDKISKSSSSSTNSSSNSSSSSTAGSVISAITSIFSSSNTATEKKIVGTWKYSEPAIVFESESLLSSTAGKVASSKIEEKLSSVLTKAGFTSNSTITFESDGSFSTSISSKTVSGTWKIEDDKLQLTISKKTISVTTQIDGSSTLQFLVDATNLLNLIQTLGSSASSISSSLSTISTLASSVDGMQIGISYTKQ